MKRTKHRLRHPIRAIREPFGTAGLILACIALVAAIGGTAWAAAKLNPTQKKEVEKIAKKFAGKPGAPGAQGPAGPAGSNGTNGKDGAPGEKGEKGDTGSQGNPGTSVTSSTVGIGGDAGHCVGVGGSKFVAASGNTYACNGEAGEEGEKGEKGDTGSPWAAGGTLPSGSTESGNWSIIFTASAAKQVGSSPISFGIPPAAEPEPHYLDGNEPQKLAAEEWHAGSGELCEGESGSELTECEEAHEALAEDCPGNAETPAAKSGNLCVYAESEENVAIYKLHGFIPTQFLFSGRTGISVVTSSAGSGEVLEGGRWALTG